MGENRFNLVDEPWIPVVGAGRVSLRQALTDRSLPALGGTPVEKVAVFKLLLAVAQSACTPQDEAEWRALGSEGLVRRVAAYLDAHHDCFYLYGGSPFLQMPAVERAAVVPFGAAKMEIATGNTTVVTQIQAERPIGDAERALLLVVLIGFAFGGKKTDNSVVLTAGYAQKAKTGKAGPSLGYRGFLHSFAMLPTLLESVYANLFSAQAIEGMKMFPGGVGVAPWLAMPEGEDDAVARTLKETYMGRLVPVNRFVLLAEDGMHYSEGIQYPDYSEYAVDPSVAADFGAKPKPKAIWTEPERRPWRQLTALLSFMEAARSNAFVCQQLRTVIPRLQEQNAASFAIWSAGVKVSSNAGEQYLTGTDDFVESEVQFSAELFKDERAFYDNLMKGMASLDSINTVLYACVNKYFKAANADGEGKAKQACSLYWQLCEGQFPKLVDACYDTAGEEQEGLYPVFRCFALTVYDETCPRDTARQMEAWAQNRPFKKNVEKEEDTDIWPMKKQPAKRNQQQPELF